MQKRSETKDTDPLYWDASSSGHVVSGSTYDEAAKRELKEELGVDKETEMIVLYKAYSEGPFILHPREIRDGMFIGKKDLKKRLGLGEIKLSFGAKRVLERLEWI